MARTPKKTVSQAKRGRPIKRHKKVNYEIISILLIALGLFIAISFFTSATGSVGEGVKAVTMGLLGLPAYLLCFVIIGAAVHFIVKRDLHKYSYKYWLCGLLVIVMSVLWHIAVSPQGEDLWALGQLGQGGGVIGGVIAQPLVPLLGFWGSMIIMVAITLVLLIVIFEISPVKLLQSLWQKISEKFEEDEDEEVYEEAGITAPEGMPEDMKREYKRIKKQIFDFEKEFSDFGKEEKTKKPHKGKFTFNKDEQNIGDVQVTQQPDTEAIEQAIEVEAEAALLPKKRKKEESEQVEIEVPTEHMDYKFPPLSLLAEPKKGTHNTQEYLERTAKLLIETLLSFGVEAKIIDYSMGPTITRYELQPNAGVKISRITSLADDIALNLAVESIRIEPIQGKSAIGIEVPNEKRSSVYVREVIGSNEFASATSKLAFSLGKDIAGKPIVGDIARMPHLLIAGSTGSGKSVCINTLIASILYKATPNEVKLIMVDPKVVELGVYNGIPHLLIPVVTDAKKAAGALQWAVNEMINRYKLFADNNVRGLSGYNAYATENGLDTLPQIVIIIDELADLMMVAPGDVEDSICRLAQMARAAGMHLVIATQRPSVNVITGIIKANIPSRIAFAVSSYVDSKTILDSGGAEDLLGKGDMLYYPLGMSKPQRLQGAFIDDKEVEKIVAFVKGQNEAIYDEDIIEQIESAGEKPSESDNKSTDADELLPQAVEMAIDAGQASVAMYQRRLKVGYQRAARLVDQMYARKIIGPFDGTKPREVLITKAQWQEMLMDMDAGGSTQTAVGSFMNTNDDEEDE